MLRIRVAELNIQIHNRYDGIEHLCRPYLHDDMNADITVDTSDQMLAFERLAAGEGFSNGYLETLAVYRAIGEQLPFFDAYIFHSAVIELDGYAYAFAAKSGTGKSTHIRHWKNAFGDRVKIINGDKPIFRFIDGKLFACGTPWAGKEGWQRNVRVPLAGICFLERGKENVIMPLNAAEALPKALSQIYLPTDRVSAENTISLLNRTLQQIPLWKLQCTDDILAAHVSAVAMQKNADTRSRFDGESVDI